MNKPLADNTIKQLVGLASLEAVGSLSEHEAAQLKALLTEYGSTAELVVLEAKLDLVAANFDKQPASAAPPIDQALEARVVAASLASLGSSRAAQSGLRLTDAPAAPTKVVTVYKPSPWPWAIAAAAAIAATVAVLRPVPTGGADILASVDRQSDVIQLAYQPADPSTQGATGSIRWSQSLQAGKVTVTNLPPADGTDAVYQMWVLDPSRDKFPIDGGTFTTDKNGNATVAFKPKLPVNKATLFAVTREKPGGVVVHITPLLLKVPVPN